VLGSFEHSDRSRGAAAHLLPLGHLSVRMELGGCRPAAVGEADAWAAPASRLTMCATPAAARSWLFVPGDRPELFSKAAASRADLVVLDLEDAVAPADKAAARDHIDDWFSRGRTAALRINSVGTPWFEDDLHLCGASSVAAVLLPKAESSDQIARTAAAMSPRSLPGVVPMIETAVGFEMVRELAATQHVVRLAFGTLDFRVDLGLADDDEEEGELDAFRALIALASRLGSVAAPIDGVTTRLNDEERVEADMRYARRFGFAAKLCIHPNQVAAVHRALAPTTSQLQWARRVLDAAQGSGGAAVQVDGRMVDSPVMLQAQAIVARARGVDGG